MSRIVRAEQEPEVPRYSDERREAVVAKLFPPHNLSPQAVADQEGISLATIYKWRREARAQGRCLPDAGSSNPENWSGREKFTAVVETAAMNAEQLGEYCRKRGLYVEQLERWRRECESAMGQSPSAEAAARSEARAERKRIRELERELRRKDAALAETAALLTLRKKAAAIWGEEDA